MRRPLPASKPNLQEASMPDLLMLAISLGLFALTIGYAYACARI
jgi:hypothetical protein